MRRPFRLNDVGASAKRFKVLAQERFSQIPAKGALWSAATCCGAGNADEFFFQDRHSKTIAYVHQLCFNLKQMAIQASKPRRWPACKLLCIAVGISPEYRPRGLNYRAGIAAIVDFCPHRSEHRYAALHRADDANGIHTQVARSGKFSARAAQITTHHDMDETVDIFFARFRR
jgi:hypothetical protein